ncbi:MAG: hypothetical protein HY319_09415 [Armatimonadetes bacterium]|nr:hypothetical protein [Armatimonadota bacterium]
MKLTQLLIQAGILAAAAPEGAPAVEPAAEAKAPVTRRVTLEELRGRAREARQESLQGDLGLQTSPEEVYRQSGIEEPQHGFRLDRLGELLREKGIGNPEAARAELVMVLAENKVPLETLLDDAQRRDSALDSYEERLVQRVKDWRSGFQQQVQALRRQAAELMEEAERLEQSATRVDKQLEDWRSRKRAAEDELERLGQLLMEPTR